MLLPQLSQLAPKLSSGWPTCCLGEANLEGRAHFNARVAIHQLAELPFFWFAPLCARDNLLRLEARPPSINKISPLLIGGEISADLQLHWGSERPPASPSKGDLSLSLSHSSRSVGVPQTPKLWATRRPTFRQSVNLHTWLHPAGLLPLWAEQTGERSGLNSRRWKEPP